MKKTLEIDLSSDRLIAIAADMVAEHNYIGALKMLNKNAELHYNDEDSYMLYAEIFDDAGLYEKCVNAWFKYIDCMEFGDLSEAYEGLAVAYMNLGNEHLSAYYYNKLLIDTEELDAEARSEIINSFLSREENPLKFVYPPKIADYSDEMSDGIDFMKCGEYEKAIGEFSKVEEENEAYDTARNYIAMCDIICDKCDEAEQECLEILKHNPDNIQALTTLAAVKTEQQNCEESRNLAKRLLSLEITSTDEIYKIATVCCENKMHAEAYDLFCKLEDELFFDSSVLYFKAVAAFNCGRYDDCFAAFDKLLTIYPDAVIARINYAAAREMAESGNVSEMSYFYRIPREDREKTLQMLAAFIKLSKADSRKVFDLLDISDCILWCFDEAEGNRSGELQYLGASCAVKAGLDGIVCDVLLNAFLSDGLKVQIITQLAERNEDNSFGVVICHMYKRVDLHALKLGRAKRRNFVAAYARLTAHFAIIDNSYGEKFAAAAEALYNEMEEGGRLAAAADTDALVAAIYLRSQVREANITRANLSEFFETSENKIKIILGEV